MVTRLRLNINTKIPDATLKERIKILKSDFISGGRDKSFVAFKTFVYNSKFNENGQRWESIHYYFINPRENITNNDTIKVRVDNFVRGCYGLKYSLNEGFNIESGDYVKVDTCIANFSQSEALIFY